jgi:hypothetical protein
MILIKKNNFFSIKFVTILFSLFIFSSLTKAQNRYFYQLGYGYVEGNSHSTFLPLRPDSLVEISKDIEQILDLV